MLPEDLSTFHDWSVKKGIVEIQIRLKGNSKRTSGNSLNPLGVRDKGIGAASQTLLTGIYDCLRRRLGMWEIGEKQCVKTKNLHMGERKFSQKH